jgi:NAD(P)-dependent dehydrogenase (short-subunit alcohol dehydrogenase family)
MDLRLTDQVIVVTGAASGIGQATARLLTQEGAVVVGVDRDPVDAGPGARVTAVQADLTDPAMPDRVIATVLERHGRIDALVNNAGGLQARTSFLDITDKQWLAAFDLNFHVARRMSRAAVPAMLDSGGGSLVHVGSDSGRLPEVGNQDYAAAKLALLALSKSLATEFSPRGIRSNVVVPGPTRTPLYDRPGGFGDQAAELWGIDKESAITRMVTQIRPPQDASPTTSRRSSPTSYHPCRARSPQPSGPSTAAPSARSDPTVKREEDAGRARPCPRPADVHVDSAGPADDPRPDPGPHGSPAGAAAGGAVRRTRG